MDDPELSREERRILDGIEEDLRGDERLGRRLRAFGRGSTTRAGTRGLLRGHLGWCAVCLGVACVALFVPAVATVSSTLLWLFAAVWVATVVCVIRVLQRGRRRRMTASTRRDAD